MRCGRVALSLLTICFMGTGCKVEVNNNGTGGEGKDVKISTPLGGLSVKTNQTAAEDLGLPAYPGARPSDDDNDESANVNMGFGSWHLGVKVASYQSADPQDKVIAFYRRALSTYGDVVECRGDKPIGSPAITNDGLSCQDSGQSGQKIQIDANDLQLKAGSIHHQHIVVFKNKGGAESEFVLVAIDLPHAAGSKHQETD